MYSVMHKSLTQHFWYRNSIVYVYKSSVFHRGWSYNDEKSVRESAALLIGVVMLLGHTPSDWKFQRPENNQINFQLATCKIYSSNIWSVCCHELYFWKWCKILRKIYTADTIYHKYYGCNKLE